MSLQAAYLAAAVIGAGGMVAAAVLANRSKLIDQLQTERTEIKTSLVDAHERIDRLGLRQRYWEDYVNELRAHIEAGNPPPPPAYPAGLLRIN